MLARSIEYVNLTILIFRDVLYKNKKFHLHIAIMRHAMRALLYVSDYKLCKRTTTYKYIHSHAHIAMCCRFAKISIRKYIQRTFANIYKYIQKNDIRIILQCCVTKSCWGVQVTIQREHKYTKMNCLLDSSWERCESL